jgi:Predicted outer membrane protein
MKSLAIVFLSLSMCCLAQTADQSSASSKGKKPAGSSDAQFAMKAAQGNMAEVALGKLATQNAQSVDVKKFGQRMVDDHTKAEQDLEGVASKDNLTLPKNMNAKQKAENQRLSKLNGAAFDRAYMRLMVQDHTKDVAEFRKESNSTSANADLRDFAKRTYPTLDEHLTMAKSIKDAMDSSATGKATKSPRKDATSSTGLLLI